MEKTSWLTLSIATLFFWASLILPAYPAEDFFEILSLKNIRGFQLIIEDLAHDLATDGLDQKQLKTEVEQQLQQAGITVDNQSEHALYIHIGTQKNETGLYSYALSLQFLQLVLLYRDLSIVTWGTTWNFELTGFIASSEVKGISQMIAHSVNVFLTDYRSANPTAQ